MSPPPLERDREVERAALSRLALDPNPAAHPASYLDGNRQPKARAAVLASGGAIALSEGLENELLLIFWDSNSSVLHDKVEQDLVTLP